MRFTRTVGPRLLAAAERVDMLGTHNYMQDSYSKASPTMLNLGLRCLRLVLQIILLGTANKSSYAIGIRIFPGAAKMCY